MKVSNNLKSLNKIKDEIEKLQPYTAYFGIENFGAASKEVEEFNDDIDTFVEKFVNIGWCLYGSLNHIIIKSANRAYKESSVNAGEEILLNYYKNNIKNCIHFLKQGTSEFLNRWNIIEVAFERHFSCDYISAVPLFLSIIDGVMQDFTNNNGFFSKDADLCAFDSIVGSDENLGKIQQMFSKSRKKINNEKIIIPYRNGILHGTDINYGNEFVSCKCVSLLFAIYDFIIAKNSEDVRKNHFEEETRVLSLTEMREQKEKRLEEDKEMKKWKKKDLIVGKDIPLNGKVDDYKGYPYIIPVITMMESWKNRNYGELSRLLKKRYWFEKNQNLHPRLCRETFENKELLDFELLLINESAVSMAQIIVKVIWQENNEKQDREFEFGSIYKGKDGEVGIPSLNNGEWELLPRKGIMGI